MATGAPTSSPPQHCSHFPALPAVPRINGPHQGTAFLHSHNTWVGHCCGVREQLGTHIAHQSLEDNKLSLELLHLQGQLLLASFSLLGFLHQEERDVQISASVEQLGCRGRGNSNAHLLQLSHPVLKLDTHRVLLFPSRETNAGQIPSASPRWPPKGEDGAAAAHPKAI